MSVIAIRFTEGTVPLPTDSPPLPVNPYRIQVRSRGFLPYPDDAGDDCESAATLVVGQPMREHTIVRPGDVDVFRISVTPLGRYRARIRPVTEEPQPEIRALTADCVTTLASDSAHEPDYEQAIAFTGPPSGSATLRVAAPSPSTVHSAAGVYLLAVESVETPIDDHGGFSGRLFEFEPSTTSPNRAWQTSVLDLGPIADDYPATEAGAPVIIAGGRVYAGRTDFLGDLDVLRVPLEGSRTYQIEIRAIVPPSFESGGVACRLGLGPESPSANVYSSPYGGPGTWQSALFTPTLPGVNKHVFSLSNTSSSIDPPDLLRGYQVRIYRLYCRGDWDGSGFLSTADIFEYLRDYLANPPSAEFDGAGADAADLNDLSSFLAAWFSGCS